MHSPWFRLGMAKAVGVMIGAVQLVPSMAALAASARQETGAAFTNSGSLHPANLVQLVAPYLLSFRVVGENTHEEGLYLGAVPLMLIVWVWVCRHELGRLRRPAAAVAGFGLLALLLAVGQYGGLYRLQRLLPWVGSFRFPCRYVVLVQLSAALLSAIGLMLLVNRLQTGRRAGRAELRPLGKVVMASAVVALLGLALHARPTIGPVPGIVVGPLLIGAAAWLVAVAARGSRRALVGLVLFAAADLGIYGLSYAVYRDTYRLDQYVAATLTPPAGSDGRVLVDLVRVDQEGLRSGNQMLLAGWNRADGYAGLEPRRRLDYRELAALRVAGVRWVRRSDATATIAGLRVFDGDWLEVPQPLPRARLVTRAAASDDPARDIHRIAIDTTSLVDAPLNLDGDEPGSARIVSERPGRIEVRTAGDSRQLLVVSESYHTGWRSLVDGRPADVLRVNGDFMGCVVGPGRHDVVLEFRPRSLRDGAIVSCLGLGFVMFGLAGAMAWPAGHLQRGVR